MTAHDFKSRWEAVVEQERERAEAAGVSEVADDLLLVSAPREILDVPSFPAGAARFLVEAGLPESCAPFLSFGQVAHGSSSLVQLYGVHQFSPEDLSRLASFHVIGSDGAGNPLCLDSARDGEIVMLDHEDGFRTRTFVASSVASLAHALLISYTLPHSEFVEHVRAFDARAADKSSFLPAELAMLAGQCRRHAKPGPEFKSLQPVLSTMQSKLIEVLREARELGARPGNDFAWSSWDSREEALIEIDGFIALLEAGEMPDRMDLGILFAPTGNTQEVAESSGWGAKFVALAERFDSAIQSV